MATITASPPAMSPPPTGQSTSSPSLPPLVTSTPTPRRTPAQRPTSYAERRMSSFSTHSKASQQPQSRPVSHVFPLFHSSLPYTLVRDFAYLPTHPLHYGPPATPSGISTPASEARRLSDPALSTWEDGRGQWSATPPWISDTSPSLSHKERLPAMTFSDGGPPYSEDDDIQSPIVTTTRHKKNKSSERGRSPGAAGPNRGFIVGSSGPLDELHGPGEAVETFQNPGLRFPHQPQHRDSNFAKPLQRNASPQHQTQDPTSEEEEYSDADDEIRFSKDYSFTIASPDEEMHGKAVALFDFESEHQNELPLKEGQVILVSYRLSQGWLVAEDPRTGESGLVPEEFVRLLRHIEGGLHGLNSVTLEPDEHTTDLTSPVSADQSSMDTPVPNKHDFQHHALKTSTGSNAEKHPPIQSTFSTSTRDFSPYPLAGRSDDATTPTVPPQRDNPDPSS